ncbi:MAG: nitroreductase family protein [Fimbriimonadaceae bacterium]|nr:nitroreductase family protein [Fimbriimonadaceae bacterium]
MDAIEALKTRRSVRAYTMKPVARELLEDLVDCARLAPTAMNVQPWEFVVVTDPATRRDLGDLCEYGSFLADAPACVAIIGREERFILQDTACAATCLMVAARAHELSTCWAHVQGKEREREISELLNVPTGKRVICCIAVGYAAEPVPPPKRPLGEVMFWEKLPAAE